MFLGRSFLQKKKTSSLKINFFSISYADFSFAVANNYSFNLLSFLIHFSHVPFYTSWKRWKHQKTRGFLRYNGFILIHWDIMDLSISYHWSISIPPENIKKQRKKQIFWCFQGVQKKTSGIKWVNPLTLNINEDTIRVWIKEKIASCHTSFWYLINISWKVKKALVKSFKVIQKNQTSLKKEHYLSLKIVVISRLSNWNKMITW